MNSVEQRLEVLERQLQASRRANRMLVGAAAALVSVVGLLASAPDSAPPAAQKPGPAPDDRPAQVAPSAGKQRLRTVEADQFVLLDRQGRARARMVVSDGGPALAMFDEHGAKRLELSQTTTASALRLFDADESPVVSLALRRNADSGSLEINSPHGKSSTRAGGLSVFDAAGHGRAHLLLINGNFPTLGLSHAGHSGPPAIEMTAGDEARRFKMHDDQGHPLLVMSCGNDGAGLGLSHPGHERSLAIGVDSHDSGGPGIAFTGPDRPDGTGGLLPYLRLGLDRHSQGYLRISDSDGATIFAAPPK